MRISHQEHPPRLRARRGFALALALMATAMIGALVAGGYLASVQDFRMGRNALIQQRATAAAEMGLNNAYSYWNKSWNSLKSGSTTTIAYNATDGSYIDTVRVTKLNQLSFLIVSEGRAGGQSGQTSARRRMGMIVRLNLPRINQTGAIVTRGNVTIGGSANILGRDTTFAGWDCPPAGLPAAGAVVPAWTNLSMGGNCKAPAYACISGSPLISIDLAAADTSTYFNYGTLTWAAMVAQADKNVSGVMTKVQPSLSVDGTCNTGDNANWGDPNRAAPANPCESYFPIIYAPGDLKVNGNLGQGILLVAGNLSIEGGFTFFGQIIVRGTAKLTGNGNHVNGGIMSAVLVDSTASSMVSGNNTIQYSRCALNTVLASTSNPTRAMVRSWAELF